MQSIQIHLVSIVCSRHSKLSEPDLFSMSEKFQLKRQNPKFPKINMNHIIPKIHGEESTGTKIFANTHLLYRSSIIPMIFSAVPG